MFTLALTFDPLPQERKFLRPAFLKKLASACRLSFSSRRNAILSRRAGPGENVSFPRIVSFKAGHCAVRDTGNRMTPSPKRTKSAVRRALHNSVNIAEVGGTGEAKGFRKGSEISARGGRAPHSNCPDWTRKEVTQAAFDVCAFFFHQRTH